MLILWGLFLFKHLSKLTFIAACFITTPAYAGWDSFIVAGIFSESKEAYIFEGPQKLANTETAESCFKHSEMTLGRKFGNAPGVIRELAFGEQAFIISFKGDQVETGSRFYVKSFCVDDRISAQWREDFTKMPKIGHQKRIIEQRENFEDFMKIPSLIKQ